MVYTLLSPLKAILRQTLNDVVCFQLQPDSAAYTMGMNQQEETATCYDDAGLTQADCKNSALTAMDDSLDGDYTISVKTEDEKADRSKEETLRVADATCLELSGSPAGRVFTIFSLYLDKIVG